MRFREIHPHTRQTFHHLFRAIVPRYDCADHFTVYEIRRSRILGNKYTCAKIGAEELREWTDHMIAGYLSPETVHQRSGVLARREEDEGESVVIQN